MGRKSTVSFVDLDGLAHELCIVAQINDARGEGITDAVDRIKKVLLEELKENKIIVNSKKKETL